MRPGRPPLNNHQPAYVLPDANYFSTDTRNVLTYLASILHTPSVARVRDIQKSVKQRLSADSKKLDSIYREMNKLRSAYQRFRELTIEEKTIRERQLRALALLGSDLTEASIANLTADDLATISVSQLRDKTPLWELIAEALEHLGDTRIFELQALLAQFNIRPTRQAIESAIETHKDVFTVRKEEREKYVSLKGA